MPMALRVLPVPRVRWGRRVRSVLPVLPVLPVLIRLFPALPVLLVPLGRREIQAQSAQPVRSALLARKVRSVLRDRRASRVSERACPVPRVLPVLPAPMAHRVGTALMAYLALRAIRVRSVLPAPLGLTAQLDPLALPGWTVQSDPRATKVSKVNPECRASRASRAFPALASRSRVRCLRWPIFRRPLRRATCTSWSLRSRRIPGFGMTRRRRSLTAVSCRGRRVLRGRRVSLASKGRRATTVLSGLLDRRVTPAIPHRLLAFSH